MRESETLVVPTCEKCGSKQIRTTKKYKVCNRCGHREELK